MSLRTLFILAAVAMALTFVTPVMAAPLAQAGVDEVVVTSTNTFTLTVMIDPVTTLLIPMRVDWRADGPNEGNTDEVLATISPTVLRQGIFSVTVGSVEPTIGTLAITLTQPVDELAPVTETTATTDTTPTTTASPTTPITGTGNTTTSVPALNTPVTNEISNLRAGPGTEYALVGSLQKGAAVDVVGQNSDGTWLVLANGEWIASFLVDNVPANLPVVTPTTTPLPAPTATEVLVPAATAADVLAPTATAAAVLAPTATPAATPTFTPIQ